MRRALKKKGRKSVEKQSMIYSYLQEKENSILQMLVKQQKGKS
jgi:hypothetical protein